MGSVISQSNEQFGSTEKTLSREPAASAEYLIQRNRVHRQGVYTAAVLTKWGDHKQSGCKNCGGINRSRLK